MVSWEWIALAGFGGLAFGQFVGAALEAWNWRMSADAHHHSHKSNGRWFRICEIKDDYS